MEGSKIPAVEETATEERVLSLGQTVQLTEQMSTPEIKDTGASARDIETERQRAAEIVSLCTEIGLEPKGFIENGADIGTVRAAAIEYLKKQSKPVELGVVADENDKYRDAMTDAMLMRSGVRVEKPANGANELRGMTIRDE